MSEIISLSAPHCCFIIDNSTVKKMQIHRIIRDTVIFVHVGTEVQTAFLHHSDEKNWQKSLKSLTLFPWLPRLSDYWVFSSRQTFFSLPEHLCTSLTYKGEFKFHRKYSTLSLSRSLFDEGQIFIILPFGCVFVCQRQRLWDVFIHCGILIIYIQCAQTFFFNSKAKRPIFLWHLRP